MCTEGRHVAFKYTPPFGVTEAGDTKPLAGSSTGYLGRTKSCWLPFYEPQL